MLIISNTLAEQPSLLGKKYVKLNKLLGKLVPIVKSISLLHCNTTDLLYNFYDFNPRLIKRSVGELIWL